MSVDPAILAKIDQSWAEMNETLDHLLEIYRDVPAEIMGAPETKRVVFSIALPMLGLNDPNSLSCVLTAALERIISLEGK